ncbi:growth-regulating factor 7-like [Bidens hawaiensis]|uniref:growth-regulating factor 7-like n=1 Tax=Bidens hawaiensis TaxID=980011 RepID=UPI00404B7994
MGYGDTTGGGFFYNHNNHDHPRIQQPLTEVGGGETSFINYVSSRVSLEHTSGLLDTGGKVLFTATQWQELEMQMTIYKYIMASIPVPPHLLIPLSTQSNKVGMDLRFSSGSDPEPWRCRRTDGKKWRCSRDVAPDQKYCERHAHKNRPRSRKPVEIHSHNNNIIASSGLNITPASSYQHHRCTEWFSGTSSNQQFQQSMSSDSHINSPRVGSKRTHMFPQNLEENLQLDSAGARRQHFIDAWSKTVGGDNCSLTLSMQCSSGIDVNDSLDLGSGDVLKMNSNQWLSQGSWMGSPPGGPLGEALGLGMASNVNRPSNEPSNLQFGSYH